MITQKGKKIFICTLSVLLLLAAASLSYSAVPLKINHQGLLQDGSGPVNGTLSVVFSIYDTASGGSSLWSETKSVSVTDGIYNAILGETVSLSILDFDTQYYLGIKVGADSEMSPRLPLSSAAYAINSDAADYAYGIADNIVTTAKIVDGAVTDTKIAGSLARDTEVTAEITTHRGDSSAHHVRYSNAEAVSAVQPSITSSISAHDADSSAHTATYYTKQEVDATIATLQAQITDLQNDLAGLQNLLAGITRDNDDITIAGANLHIVNGTGTTGGAVNGLGNLIIGYNETRASSDDRTGSHNLIVGRANNYTSYGSIVGGFYNEVANSYASVTGGQYNTASGLYSSVTGGNGNTASGLNSSITGGVSNTASGNGSSVTGGAQNIANNNTAAVNGGYINVASGVSASISGGTNNAASGQYSAVSGGSYNIASGQKSSVSGGSTNEARQTDSSVSGGMLNIADADKASITGGWGNYASGQASSISGGFTRVVTGGDDWRAGGLFQDN